MKMALPMKSINMGSSPVDNYPILDAVLYRNLSSLTNAYHPGRPMREILINDLRLGHNDCDRSIGISRVPIPCWLYVAPLAIWNECVHLRVPERGLNGHVYYPSQLSRAVGSRQIPSLQPSLQATPGRAFA